MISELDMFPAGRDNNAEIFYGLDFSARYKGFALTVFFRAANYTLLPTAQMRGPLMWEETLLTYSWIVGIMKTRGFQYTMGAGQIPDLKD